MKCVILAAGYATRLYPLTENFPKPLLDVNGKSILDWLCQDVIEKSCVDELIVISNHKFVEHFEKWKAECGYPVKITILDDGSTDNEHRLGAVKDIAFAIEQCQIADDTLVLAGDNVLDFSLGRFVDYALAKNGSCVMRHFEGRLEKLQKTGVAEIDDNDLIISMEEKPKEPKSNWAVPPFYFYKKEDLHRIGEAIESGQCNIDAPGDFIAWLCGQCDVYAFEMPGKRFDIGDLKSYEAVKAEFKGIINTK